MVDPTDSLELPPLHYFIVAVNKEPLRALVDSGLTRTILGAKAIQSVRRLNLPTRQRVTRIRTANGQIARAREEVDLSFRLGDRIRTISVCLLPDLTVSCLVGMDFLRKFGVVVDYELSEWNFRDSPAVRYLFELPNQEEWVCCGLPELTPLQNERLVIFGE